MARRLRPLLAVGSMYSAVRGKYTRREKRTIVFRQSLALCRVVVLHAQRRECFSGPGVAFVFEIGPSKH